MGAIGVGIIGVTPGRSWGALAHIPALQASSRFDLRAVSTTRKATAQAAAEAFGVPRAFDSAEALASAPDVDLVVVTVKVPHHHELVMAALQAGKHVYCEWPLGRTLDEAIEMEAVAGDRGVIAAVGLQARLAPAIAYARDLVAQGYVGTPLSTTMVGSGMNWGAQIDESDAYLADKRNGATMLSIPVGHAVDGLCHVLGEFHELDAFLENRRTTTLQVPGNLEIPLTSEDQVLIQGRLESGTAASIHYRGGLSRGTNFLWEINGTEGDLQITADLGHPQIFPLTIAGAQGEAALQPLAVPENYFPPPGLPPFAQNVAKLYDLLADDIANGTRATPSFGDAVRRHQFLEAVSQASDDGKHTVLSG